MRRALYQHAVDCFGAEQVMTFLGRKYPGDFRGKCERTGISVSRARRSSTGSRATRSRCMTRPGRVLRIETVINDPKEFFVHRPRLKKDGTEGGRLVSDE